MKRPLKYWGGKKHKYICKTKREILQKKKKFKKGKIRKKIWKENRKYING